MSTPCVTAPAVRYPAGKITKHGAYYLLKGTHPEMKLRAYDGSIVFSLMGGQAIPHRTAPESVLIKDLKGLIPPWRTVDQKGATDDGTTFLDALYDPIEVDATVLCRGRDAQRLRKVVRDLIASIDVKQTSDLSWFTQELGYWWAPVRWFKTPPDKYEGAQKLRQQLSLVLRADSGFWRTFDDVDQFRFAYQTASDTFDYATTAAFLDNWTVHYSGTGGGGVGIVNGQLAWINDAGHPVTGAGITTICRRTGATETDNQVVEFTLGTFPAWSFPQSAHDDIWARMNETGTPGQYGIRLRLSIGNATLSYFVNGVEKVLRSQPILPPLPGENWSLVAGYDSGNERTYKVMRGGSTVMNVVENGTSSTYGSGYRGRGLGMFTAPGLFGDARPGTVRQWNADDNSTGTQNGFLTRVNVGDQPRFDRYTCFGPGLFNIADGPGGSPVQFGPLLPGQIMQLRTDPRKGGIADLTSTPSTPQQQSLYNTALEDLASFASANNAPQLLKKVASIFGVTAPQGNPYTLLNGRFSTPIPAKSPGNQAQPQHIAVSISGGNADSMILAAGTPLRRYPI